MNFCIYRSQYWHTAEKITGNDAKLLFNAGNKKYKIWLSLQLVFSDPFSLGQDRLTVFPI